MPADGETVLSYGQAVQRDLAWEVGEDGREDRTGSVTVRRVVERYLAWYRAHRRSYDRIRYNFEAHVLPELGSFWVESLTAHRFRTWHQKLAEKPARLRGGHERDTKTEDQRRARKVTANRVLKDLKAALNRAVEDGLVESDQAWRRVKKFEGVEVARAEYLEPDELRRLLEHCREDFRDLVLAAIYTGGRYSELAGLRVEDFRPEVSAVHFPKTKSGAPRFVYLAGEGMAFFETVTEGRFARERMLLKEDGTAWGRNHHYRLMRSACEAAELDRVGFHQLRHTYASLYLMSGGSLIALAKQLGHTTTRMVEKHYGHLADSWRAAEAEKHAPALGLGGEDASERSLQIVGSG